MSIAPLFRLDDDGAQDAIFPGIRRERCRRSLRMSGLLIVAIGALIASFLGICAVRTWAARWGMIDIPNARSSHDAPTPRGGGIIFLPLAAFGLGTSALFSGTWLSPTGLWYLVLAGMIALVSWFDDLRGLGSTVRLVVHSLAAIAAIVAFGGWDLVQIPVLGEVSLGVGGFLITFVWIVGLTNAYNFMDGVDGIAGIQGAVAGLGWAVLAFIGGWQLAATIGAIVAGSAIGFLVHNWPPAAVFMGDVGSAWLGFTFAVLPLIADPSDPYLPVAAGLFVWPFVVDAAFTFARRLTRGENVFAAHRSHLYQRLVRTGWSHRRVTVLYGALGTAGCVMGWAWWADAAASPGLYPAAVFLLAVLLVRLAQSREAAAASSSEVSNAASRNLPGNNRSPQCGTYPIKAGTSQGVMDDD